MGSYGTLRILYELSRSINTDGDGYRPANSFRGGRRKALRKINLEKKNVIYREFAHAVGNAVPCC
jgi:hypothetical protein